MIKIPGRHFIKNLKICLFFTLIAAFSSCINTKKYTYFSNLRDTAIISSARIAPRIHKNDLLSISVSSLNPEASLIFNTGSSEHATGPAGNPYGGYLINEEGNIQFPVLGSVRANGLTVKQLTDTITAQLVQQKLLVEPVVTIRITNFNVTVIGEVRTPTVLTVPSQSINVLQALGLAGDLTQYARRDNILIIHEEFGKKTIRRIDLTSKKLLSSPDYYLRSNDVVYVEANKNKARSSSNGRQILPILFSALSLVVVTLNVIYSHQ